MFSGGTYGEVARWLQNFVTSHAKRENVHVEVELDVGGEREGKSYGARLRLGARLTPLGEFDFQDVAQNRGSLAWCAARAEQTRAGVRDLIATAA